MGFEMVGFLTVTRLGFQIKKAELLYSLQLGLTTKFRMGEKPSCYIPLQPGLKTKVRMRKMPSCIPIGGSAFGMRTFLGLAIPSAG